MQSKFGRGTQKTTAGITPLCRTATNVLPVQKEASAFLYISQIELYFIGKRTKRSLFSANKGSEASASCGMLGAVRAQ